jgi:hypothetical protein
MHARDDPALMRRVEEQRRADLVGDGAQLGHRVFVEVQAAADGDEPGAFGAARKASAAVSTV